MESACGIVGSVVWTMTWKRNWRLFRYSAKMSSIRTIWEKMRTRWPRSLRRSSSLSSSSNFPLLRMRCCKGGIAREEFEVGRERSNGKRGETEGKSKSRTERRGFKRKERVASIPVKSHVSTEFLVITFSLMFCKTSPHC